MKYQDLMEKLWFDYSHLNPIAKKVHQLLKVEGENVINDHIAFRTFDIKGINLEDISQVFKASGYVEKGKYYFKDKQLNAKHYEHKTDNFAPKVFISELITSSFSENMLKVANNIAGVINKNKFTHEDLIFSKNCWKPFSYQIYEELRKESEYGAWLYVFGFRANHFTVYINYLKKYNTIDKLNKFLKDNEIVLNNSGGEIKGTDKELLKQSSTMADVIDVEFIEGIKKIPCCYYEFAQRYKDNNGNIFNGFIATSADKIFESTDNRK